MRTAKITLCLAACALSASLTNPRILSQSPASSKSTPAQPERLPDMIRTSGRILITAPTQPLYLGEETALAVTFQGPPPRIISTEQSTAEATEHSQNIQSSYADAKLERREDGQTCITVVPQRPGKLNIRVHAVFSDGGYDMASVTVDVVARKPPVKLSGEFAMKGIDYILMDLTEERRSRRLFLSATYAGVKDTLSIMPGQNPRRRPCISRPPR